MSDIRTQIEQIVASAAQQIALLVQQAAADGVAASLAALSDDSSSKTVSKSNGRRKAASTGPRGASGSKGAKRPPEALAKLAEKVAAFISKKPGLRIEQINKELGTTTKELALPLRKLIAEKAISTKGEKRATTYYAKRK